MTEVMTRDEVLRFYSEMIRKAVEDWRSFEDSESRRRYMNSIAQVLNLFNSVSKTQRMDQIEAEIKDLKERLKI